MPLPDLRFALRSLARSRGFATTVILTLGLGIGANTAIFSVVRAVLLKPLPHREGDRLVYLRQSIEGPGGENIRFSVPEILDFRNSAKSLQGIAEYSGVLLTLQGKDDAVRMQVGLVTGNYFQVMGLSPVLGRVLDERDDGTGVPPVVVLTHDYWHQRFGGDATIVGKSVRIDGRAVEVVGVLQPAPTFPERFDALMNMVISEHHTSAMMVHGRTHRMTDMIARLAPGATLDQARSEVATIRKRVQAEFPEAYDAGSGYRVTVTPFVEVLGERARLTLWLLMGAAAFVMVISAANVANLSLMRGVRREHELVIRSALGAGTARLRRLLLVENLLLASAGAVLGLLIAIGGVRLLAAFAERYSSRANEIRIDGVVLAFTLLLTVAIAILISYAPRLAAEGRLGTLIAAGASRASGSLARQRLQRTLVVAQVAVSVVLLTGAGLLTRTMQRLSSVDSGLTAEEVLTMEVPISGGGGATPTPRHCTRGCARRSAPSPGCGRWGWAPPCRCARHRSSSTSRERGTRLQLASRSRAPNCAPPTPTTSRRRPSPCSRGASSRARTATRRRRSSSSTRRWPGSSFPGAIPSGGALPGPARSSSSSGSAASGAPSSAWWATPGTAGSTPRRAGSSSPPSRRSSPTPGGS